MQSITDVPLSIDSSIVEALEAGLAVYQGKPLVNSVTGEDEQMERVLPLVAKYGAAVVAITNDETGISRGSRRALRGRRKIVTRAADHGIPRDDVVVDPLVMPIGAMGTAGQQVFRLVRRLQDELRVNTTCGASNVSFGLPNRTGDQRRVPVDGDRDRDDVGDHEPAARRGEARDQAADVLMGTDEHCAAWIARNGDRRGAAAAAGPAAAAAARADAEGRRAAQRAAEPRAEHLVVFTPSGRRGAVRDGTTVLDAARRARRRPRLGVRRPRHLRPLPGRGRARASSPSTGSPRARRTCPDRRGRGALRGRQAASPPAAGSDARRTSAATLVVDVPPESQVHRQVVRKEADAHPIEIDPVVRLHYVEVEEPDLASPTSDLGRLREALEREWELAGLDGRRPRAPGPAEDAPRTGALDASPSRCTTSR